MFIFFLQQFYTMKYLQTAEIQPYFKRMLVINGHCISLGVLNKLYTKTKKEEAKL